MKQKRPGNKKNAAPVHADREYQSLVQRLAHLLALQWEKGRIGRIPSSGTPPRPRDR